MYYKFDEELTTLLRKRRVNASCSFNTYRWQHFSAWNDVIVDVLKV